MSSSLAPLEPDDHSLEMMHEMQRDYLRRGGTSTPAVMKLNRTPYVHQDYPKWVRVGGVELGIAATAEAERTMLEAHAATTGQAIEAVRADNEALSRQAQLLQAAATWTPDMLQAALDAAQRIAAAPQSPVQAADAPGVASPPPPAAEPPPEPGLAERMARNAAGKPAK